MTGMANLHTDLRGIIDTHRHSENPEVQDLLRDLELTLDTAGPPAYQHRHHPTWDTTWMELDESQVAIVLERGHTVERQLLLDAWETVTEVPA
jgi:hypothetical protein